MVNSSYPNDWSKKYKYNITIIGQSTHIDKLSGFKDEEETQRQVVKPINQKN